MEEKCFCHFNGYEVKDAYARRELVKLENWIIGLMLHFGLSITVNLPEGTECDVFIDRDYVVTIDGPENPDKTFTGTDVVFCNSYIWLVRLRKDDELLETKFADGVQVERTYTDAYEYIKLSIDTETLSFVPAITFVYDNEDTGNGEDTGNDEEIPYEIHFYVDGIEYTAMSNMTFYEWYQTDNGNFHMFMSGDEGSAVYESASSSKVLKNSKGETVKATDIIIENGEYSF